MKLTKGDLKKIIEEEVSKVLKEKSPPCDPNFEKEINGKCVPASPTDLKRGVGQNPLEEDLDDIMLQQLEKSSPHMARNLKRLTRWLINQAREIHNSGNDPGPWIKEGVRELQSLKHPLAKEAARVLILDGHGTYPVINLIHSLWKDQKEGTS